MRRFTVKVASELRDEVLEANPRLARTSEWRSLWAQPDLPFNDVDRHRVGIVDLRKFPIRSRVIGVGYDARACLCVQSSSASVSAHSVSPCTC